MIGLFCVFLLFVQEDIVAHVVNFFRYFYKAWGSLGPNIKFPLGWPTKRKMATFILYPGCVDF